MTQSNQVEFELVRRAALSRARTRDMFELLSRHFEGVSAEQFQQDLAGKSLAALLHRDEKLVAFRPCCRTPRDLKMKPST